MGSFQLPGDVRGPVRGEGRRCDCGSSLTYLTFLFFFLAYSVMSNSLQPHGLLPTQAPLSMDSPGKNTVVGCHALLQRIFPTQGSDPHLLHCRWILHPLSHLTLRGVAKDSLGSSQQRSLEPSGEQVTSGEGRGPPASHLAYISI